MSSEVELPDVVFLHTVGGKISCSSIQATGGKGALARIPRFSEMYLGMKISLHWSAQSSDPDGADVKAKFDFMLVELRDVDVLIRPYLEYLGTVRQGTGEAYYTFVDSAGWNHVSQRSSVLLDFRSAAPGGICTFPEN